MIEGSTLCVSTIVIPVQKHNMNGTPMKFYWGPSDTVNSRKFRNDERGEIINSDPRLLFPEALVERGVPLKTIILVLSSPSAFSQYLSGLC